MKIEFFYSSVYFNHLNKFNSIDRNWSEVKKIGRNFEKRYQSEIKKILNVLPKVVGKPWRKETKEVYIVDWAGPSFSHPLTLKVFNDSLLMLVILTHELLHDFYLNEKNIEKIELKINQRVAEVFAILGIDIKDQWQTIEQNRLKRFEKK